MTLPLATLFGTDHNGHSVVLAFKIDFSHYHFSLVQAGIEQHTAPVNYDVHDNAAPTPCSNALL